VRDCGRIVDEDESIACSIVGGVSQSHKRSIIHGGFGSVAGGRDAHCLSVVNLDGLHVIVAVDDVVSLSRLHVLGLKNMVNDNSEVHGRVGDILVVVKDVVVLASVKVKSLSIVIEVNALSITCRSITSWKDVEVNGVLLKSSDSGHVGVHVQGLAVLHRGDVSSSHVQVKLVGEG